MDARLGAVLIRVSAPLYGILREGIEMFGSSVDSGQCSTNAGIQVNNLGVWEQC